MKECPNCLKMVDADLVECTLFDCPFYRRKSTANDPVNRPAHYTLHPSGVECIQITRHMNFNLGNAVKYIWRAGDKGNEIEDLKKAAWYIADEIKRLEGTQK